MTHLEKKIYIHRMCFHKRILCDTQEKKEKERNKKKHTHNLCVRKGQECVLHTSYYYSATEWYNKGRESPRHRGIIFLNRHTYVDTIRQ